MQNYEENLAARVNGQLQPLLGVSVTVKDSNGITASLYSDDGVTPLPQPLVTDKNGYFGFYAANGRYTLTFTGSQIGTVTRSVELYDKDEAPPVTQAALAAPTGAALVGNGGESVKDSLDAMQLTDYAALRAYTGPRKSVYVAGYLVSASPSGIAGLFTRDDSDTTSADNGGTNIVASNGKRWKRVFGGEIDVRWFGADDTGVTDSSAQIQAALDLRANNSTIVGGGKTYRLASPIYVRGTQKIFDVENGQLLLDFATDNLQGVVIDNPTGTPTKFQGLKNVAIYAVGSTTTKAGIVGVLLKDGVHNTVTENVSIQVGGAIGFEVRGGPLGGSDTPYYGTHTNLKVQFCQKGVYVHADGTAPIITTHTFINPTVGGCSSHGVHFYNAQSCTLICPMIEGNSGTGIRLEKSGEIYSVGGFIEGNNPNIEYIDCNPNYGNIILTNVYPSAGGTGTTTATYNDYPPVAFQSNIIHLPRVGSPQLNFQNNDILELKLAGMLSVYGSDGRYARFALINSAPELIEAAGIGSANWSTTKDTASKINVYFEGGKYWIQNKVGSLFVRLHAQQGF